MQPTFKEKIEKVVVWIGAIGMEFSAEQAAKTIPVSVGGAVPVHLHVTGGRLFADVEIWNGGDKPPVEVKDNEFVLRPPSWDRNSNEQALEIVDENQKVVFQLIYKTSSVVVVNGLFPGTHGQFLLASPDGFIINPSSEQLLENRPKPLFRYLSWQHPHEQVNNAARSPIAESRRDRIFIGSIGL